MTYNSCYPFDREFLGWSISAVGACLTAVGIYKIWQKEKPNQPITLTNNNAPIIINVNTTSNTAKGATIAAIGLYIANKGINILNKN